MNPVLSIVIPNFNGEKYLEHLVNTLFKQDVPDDQYEVIFVDDGSSDASVKIMRTLTREKLNVHILRQENSGVSTARNRGGYWLTASISGLLIPMILFRSIVWDT